MYCKNLIEIDPGGKKVKLFHFIVPSTCNNLILRRKCLYTGFVLFSEQIAI